MPMPVCGTGSARTWVSIQSIPRSPSTLPLFPLMLGHTPQPAGPCPVKDASKAADYADSTKWLFGDGLQGQGALDTVLPKARLAMMLFPLCLALTAFLFTRCLFGDASGLAALALIAFEPTLIAHGPLVTTDSAVSAMALLTVAAFYLFHRRPSASMFLFAGLSCGLTFAVKHSGVLIVPTLFVLASFEVASRWRQRNTSAGAVILCESLTFFGVLLAGWVVLWAAYHFHFPARPAAILAYALPGRLHWRYTSEEQPELHAPRHPHAGPMAFIS